jgi:hypothetical protein
MMPASPRLTSIEERLLAARPLWAALAVIEAAFIFWTSHRSWEGASDAPAWVSNLLHFPLYAALGGASALAFGAGGRDSGWPAFLSGVLAAVAFGALDEWHQTFVPGRSADPLDLVTDCAGAVFAALLLAARVRIGWTPGLALGLIGALGVALLASF